jgi:protein-S-isoprenylcysteine O-methyltransferase
MEVNSLRILDVWVLFLWLTIDGFVVFRRRAGASNVADRFSTLGIALATWVGIGVAISLGFAGVGALGVYTVPVQIFGLALLVAGIVIRSVAIAQLGRFHTPIVAIQVGHRVVDTGLYRHVRHPSYLGACIAFFGFGLGLGSWLGAVFLVGVTLLAYAYRIHVEERALLESLGDQYAAYRKRTCRLIPGVY